MNTKHKAKPDARSAYHRKGYLYTLEVLISLSVVIITLISVFKTPEQKPEFELSIIKTNGFDALQYLDYKGDLKKFIAQRDELAIENSLKDILKDFEFETEICRSNCSDVNVPKNETVIIVDYYSSGYLNYDNEKVRLWMWRKY